MKQTFVLKKVLMIFPTVFILMVIVFFLSNLTLGDKVNDYISINGSVVSEDDNIKTDEYVQVAKSLNLDLPLFYFSIHPIAFSDTLYKSNQYPNHELIKTMVNKYGSWKAVNKLIINLEEVQKIIKKISLTSYNENFELFKTQFKSLYNTNDYNDFKNSLDKATKIQFKYKLEFNKKLNYAFLNLVNSHKNMIFNRPLLSSTLPSFAWYGTDNRFHQWFVNVLHFDFGISNIDGQSVDSKIFSSLKWTLFYILVAFILTYGLAIPLGIYTASNKNTILSKAINLIFVGFHAIPLFWLSTLAVIFLTSSEITSFFNIFPSIGLGDIDSDMNIMQQFNIAFPHLILPSIIIAIHAGAYLSNIIKTNILKEMDKKYYISLLSRGISRKKVILKHIFPNSILPLITLIVVSLPASLAGSVITEVIFNIPGMGRLLYDSIIKHDWNVVFAIVLLIGIVTYISYVIGDIIYSYLNPKIKLT